MNGLLNVYKEAGFTSMDVVAKLRGILKTRKIGHTGTLDPDATGVLPICIGNATKLCDMLTDTDKEYEAEMLLGRKTDTLDDSGTVLEEKAVAVSEDRVREVVSCFVGGYNQIPPMYSALKVNGQKLCDLARAGKTVERKPRRVEIYSIEILEMKLPIVKMRIACGKGTYIRSLCDDIGEKLGCGACMKSLIRTRAAGFRIESSYTLDQVQQMADRGQVMEHIIPTEHVFEHLYALTVTNQYEKLLQNGNQMYAHMLSESYSAEKGEQVRIYHADGRFCGVFTFDGRCYKPDKIFEL